MAKSWFEKKMENQAVAKEFKKEYLKLSIGEQLVKLRLEAGLSQAELAKKIGTSAPAICRYENADYDNYEIQTIRKIVEACGGEIEINIKSKSAS